MRFKLLILIITTSLSAQNIANSLETVINAFNGIKTDDRHLTHHLLDIAKNGRNIDYNDKVKLEALGFNFGSRLISRGGSERPESVGLDKFLDSEHFRFHYSTSGPHAVDTKDIDNNLRPDYVEEVIKVFDYVADKLHNEMGYTRPPSDGYYSSTRDKGGSNHYDIYIRSIPSKYYGYVQPEEYSQGNGDNERSELRNEKNAFTSYMAIRNNYKKFSLSELENIKVTAAHEYFHAIQFGYDGWEKPWLLEASAIWMEEEIYDEINDCYQYMKDWFKYPHKSLDESGFHWYGSFIFFEYIEQHMGGSDTIRKIMEASVQSNSKEKDGSHLAINQALKLNNHSFQKALNGMSVANQIMSSFESKNYSYEEAENYPVDGPNISDIINFQFGRKDTINSSKLSRFGSEYFQVISNDPVLINLTNKSGSLPDLQLNAILKKNDNSYSIISSPSINIDPSELKSIFLSIVSQDTIGGNWDYQLSVENGKSGTNINSPIEFVLNRPYPNPFNGSIKFSLYVIKDSKITIDLIGINGRRIIRLFSGELSSGNHNYNWRGIDQNGNQVSSGVYYIKVSGEKTGEWKPITFLK
ncbi:MAG: MXAN_6640 family putative metalloprotease [Candidatus Neomarinimicrobiota bacterium]|nr:MXAN_6640 family putative metalloprotease [Candidatus Neomarinimicrobiota bacterium]